MIAWEKLILWILAIIVLGVIIYLMITRLTPNGADSLISNFFSTTGNASSGNLPGQG